MSNETSGGINKKFPVNGVHVIGPIERPTMMMVRIIIMEDDVDVAKVKARRK